MIFVFGSNERGYHGAGAAWTAYEDHGAQYMVGRGRTGQAYAIPTKGFEMEKLPLGQVAENIEQFLDYAKGHPEETFKVTQIGCGYAGFTASQIAPLFADAPENCLFDEAWSKYLGPIHKYWGTWRKV